MHVAEYQHNKHNMLLLFCVCSDLSEDSDALSPSGYTLALPGSSFDQRAMTSLSGGRSLPGNEESDRPHLDLSSAVYPQFSTASSRLATFTNWPADLMATFPPQMLVALGFYFAGKS